MITVRDLAFDFGKKALIRGLSTSFDDKRLTAVIGPNGAGKTTLLKLLAGILTPENGSIDRTESVRSNDLMWLPAHIEMPFAYTVREVIAMLLHPWLRPAAPGTAAALVTDALITADLADFGSRVFSSLSAGEQHRVALGAAIVSGAGTLILDEPCANLDIGAAHQMLLRLRKVRDTGRTLIISIHDLQLAWEYCDDILLLAPGHGSVKGSARQVFASTAFSSAFQVNVQFVQTGTREVPVFGTGDL